MKNIHHPLYHTMAVYRGKSYVTCECVTGRLSFVETKKEGPSGAVIAVITPPTEAAYMAADGPAFSAVAAIFVGEQPSDALCAFASQHEIPFLILSRLPEEHNGRVAIVDSRTGTLYVDPDLETLSRYARALSLPHGLSFSPLLLSAFSPYPLMASSSALFDHATLIAGESLSFAASLGEEGLFEALRELGEEHVGAPRILPVRVYDFDTTDLLCERLRAILRAAVFAPFSLLFEGICCLEELEKAMRVLAQVKDTLAREGREHDRTVSVGIAVESPLLLYELRRARSVDYVCLDWERLLRSVLPPFAGKPPSIEAKDAFCAMLGEYLGSLSLPLCARTVHPPISKGWPSEAMAAMGIRVLFVPQDSLPAWQEKKTPTEAEKN